MVLLFRNKDLIITKNTRLYQKENAIDKIVFYVPEKYEDYDLSEFTVMLSYIDPGNVAHMEELVKLDESSKDDYLEYQLPVTTELTSLAGDVVAHLSFTQMDQDEAVQHVMHSSDVTITIDTWEDHFRFVPNSALSAIDTKMLEIDNEMQKLKTIADEINLDMPNDLELTDDLLQLRNSSGVIGDGVEILVNIVEPDSDADGQIDLDNISDDGDSDETISEIDLG